MFHPSRLALLAAFACTLPLHAADPLRSVIDQRISQAWAQQKITPAKPGSDSEFLRRVTLDLIGEVPTYEETVAFLDDKDSAKREKLVDKLIADPRFGIHQADVWDMILFGRRPPGYETHLRDGFRTWLASKFEKNTPYNEWARDLLKAEGDSVDGGAMYLVQYRSAPEDAVEAIAQTFLGVQLQCARCHNHPYEKWKQKEFFGMAAFLARLEVVQIGKKGNLNVYAIGEKNSGDVKFTGRAQDAKPGDKGEPVKPKFLLANELDEPPVPKDFKEVKFVNNQPPPKPKFSRKDALADWITKPDNPFFARAIANRMWAQFMGRGLVHPVDNLSPSNVPSHPELLNSIAKEIVEHKFDLKWLIRELVNSKAYQLSGTGTGEPMPQWFQHARSRPLSAEELIESWRVVTGYAASEKANPRKGETGRYRPLGEYVVHFFGTPNTGTGDFQGGLHEHLYLNNGPLSQMIQVKGGVGEYIADVKKPIAERVERLFLTTLNRRPAPEEVKKFAAFLEGKNSPSDAAWALITGSEFRFNH
jgi:Protein of unknown function (DUF1549)/Protein of unknown function (DUF1553)